MGKRSAGGDGAATGGTVVLRRWRHRAGVGGAGGTGSNAAHALLERTFAGSEVLRIDGRAPKHIAPFVTLAMKGLI